MFVRRERDIIPKENDTGLTLLISELIFPEINETIRITFLFQYVENLIPRNIEEISKLMKLLNEKDKLLNSLYSYICFFINSLDKEIFEKIKNKKKLYNFFTENTETLIPENYDDKNFIKFLEQFSYYLSVKGELDQIINRLNLSNLERMEMKKDLEKLINNILKEKKQLELINKEIRGSYLTLRYEILQDLTERFGRNFEGELDRINYLCSTAKYYNIFNDEADEIISFYYFEDIIKKIRSIERSNELNKLINLLSYLPKKTLREIVPPEYQNEKDLRNIAKIILEHFYLRFERNISIKMFLFWLNEDLLTIISENYLGFSESTKKKMIEKIILKLSYNENIEHKNLGKINFIVKAFRYMRDGN